MKEPIEYYSFLLRTSKRDTVYWINKHKKWCALHHINPKEITKTEIIAYIDHLVEQYYHKPTVNYIVDRVSFYYEYLIEQEQIQHNPFTDPSLQAEKQRVLQKATSMIYVPNRRDF